MTPYGDSDLGQHWLGQWLDAWRHQAITWTNVDVSSVRSSGIHLRAIPTFGIRARAALSCVRGDVIWLHRTWSTLDQVMAWCHHVDLASVGPCGICLRTISRELFKISIKKMSLKINKFKIVATCNELNTCTNCLYIIDSLRVKFCRGNINIYLHFMSLLHIDKTQVLKILPQVRPGPTYSI